MHAVAPRSKLPGLVLYNLVVDPLSEVETRVLGR